MPRLRTYGVTALFIGLLSQGALAQDTRSIKRQIIQTSIASYPGSCPCPYSRMRNGRACGGHSAWSKPRGRSPICYAEDISDAMVESWKARILMNPNR